MQDADLSIFKSIGSADLYYIAAAEEIPCYAGTGFNLSQIQTMKWGQSRVILMKISGRCLSSRSISMAEMNGATFWQGSDTGSEVTDSETDEDREGSEDEDGKQNKKLEDDGEDPFDEEENLENPLQSPNAEASAAAPSSMPMANKRLFVEVSPIYDVKWLNCSRSEKLECVRGILFLLSYTPDQGISSISGILCTEKSEKGIE